MRPKVWQTWLALLVALLVAAPAWAQDDGGEPPVDPFGPAPGSEAPPAPAADPDAPGIEPFEELSDEEQPTSRQIPDDELERYYEIREATRRQLQTGQNAVHIYQLVEEMVDEVVADVSAFANPTVISPAAVRMVGLTPNLNAEFGQFVEATLVTSLASGAGITLKRCMACESMRSRIEDDDWVVTLGMTRQEDLQREAKRLGVKAFLEARFSWFPGANIVALNVQFVRAEDGAILWAETYRSDATTAAILRSGDRVVSRAEREKELERLLEARPYYGHMLYVGGSFIPYDGPQGGIGGAALGYRLWEKFGEDRRWMFGIGAEGFLNLSPLNPLLGSFIGASFGYELFPPDLNEPIYRVGGTVAGFIAGQEGNSISFQADFDMVLQFRLGFGVSAMYFVPVQFAGADLGGFGGKARASFNW